MTETKTQSVGQTTKLVRLALSCLPKMYQRERGLFCFRMVEHNGRMTPLDVSVRYTAMTIIGLRRAEESGHRSTLAIGKLLDGLLKHENQSLSLGDLGLMLWATAACDPDRAEPLLQHVEKRWNDSKHPAVGNALSMHLAWLLTGLCVLWQRKPALTQAERLMQEVYKDLLNSHYDVRVGLFFYRSRQASSLRQKLIRRICYLAEQVYGIHALDVFSRLTQDQNTAAYAVRTAQLLCSHQNAKGGWAWLYDATSGALIDPYPVYTVHQLGMGPMAMLPLARDGNVQISQAVERGVEWVFGNNELGVPLVDEERGIIWRSIKARHLPRQSHLIHKTLAAAGVSRIGQMRWLQPSAFQIDRECRPYELGWLLYALSGVA